MLAAIGTPLARILRGGRKRIVRVRISTKPPVGCIDGIQLTHLRPGVEYEVGAPVAEVLIVEGWAEPVGFDRPMQHVPASSAGRRERRLNVIRVGPMETA